MIQKITELSHGFSPNARLFLWFPLFEDTSHEHFAPPSKRPGAAAGLVSREFMSSLSAEVGRDAKESIRG
jgi:hypothetical protein